MPKPGPRPRPLDEERALALLREGRPAYKVRREFGVGMRRIVRLAGENGIELHRRRPDRALRRQEALVRRMRLNGLSWERIAERLGYAPGAMQSIARRALRGGDDAGIRMHARTRRHILRELRRINRASRPDDVDSFVRLARDPRRRWLLSPREIDLAKRKGLIGKDEC